MSRVSAFLVFAAFVLSDCELLGSDGLGSVEFTTSQGEYESVDTIQATLTNFARQEISMGAC